MFLVLATAVYSIRINNVPDVIDIDSTITPTQFIGYTRSQLINNIDSNYEGHIIDEGKARFYYTIQTAEPSYNDGTLSIRVLRKPIYGEVNLEDYRDCRVEYSKTICINAYVKSNTETLLEFPTESKTITSARQKLVNKAKGQITTMEYFQRIISDYLGNSEVENEIPLLTEEEIT